jgi:hypothetical protein
VAAKVIGPVEIFEEVGLLKDQALKAPSSVESAETQLPSSDNTKIQA